tara:strand:+ start:969 stop:1322 length:354 start_codon:yes stop_codon:yes gene_type:complete
MSVHDIADHLFKIYIWECKFRGESPSFKGLDDYLESHIDKEMEIQAKAENPDDPDSAEIYSEVSYPDYRLCRYLARQICCWCYHSHPALYRDYVAEMKAQEKRIKANRLRWLETGRR